MNKKELKRCPFCGGEAKEASSKFAFNDVYCESCGARTTAFYMGDAIKAWNKRVDGAKTDESCEKSCKDENATCKENLQLTRKDIEKMVKLNYHEYKEPRYYYLGETDSIAGMYFKIKVVDGADDLSALAIELYKEDEDGSIDFLTDYQTIHSAIKAAEEWLVDLVCSVLGVEE